MGSYTINSGDNLWNICKRQFNLNNNTDIANAVNKIAKANNIKNENLIFAGQKLDLSAMDGFERTTQTKNNTATTPIAPKTPDATEQTKEKKPPAQQVKEYSQEIKTAVETKIKNSDIKTVEDIDNLAKSEINIFSENTKTEPQKTQAYLDYSEKLLSDYYDLNKDGKVTAEEFEQKEFQGTQKSTNLTIEQIEQQGGTVSDEEKKQFDKIAKRTANLFSKNLDMNGDGIISKEELAFFNKNADGLDGKEDGKIKGAAESKMFEAVTGMNAADKEINRVVNKYLLGQDLTADEQKILESSTVKIRKAMSKAAGLD